MAPTRLIPAKEEALDGYLDRASHVLGWPVLLVRRSLGLPEPTTGPPAAISLDAHHAEILDDLWHVPPGTAQRMTLLGRFPALSSGKLRPSAPDITHAASRTWFFASGSRYCPACLAETGVWRVSWRLPWTVICSDHMVNLADACPQCAGWPRSGKAGKAAARRVDEHVRAPHLCHLTSGFPSQGRGSQQCGGDLTQQSTKAATRESALLQRALDSALQGESMTIAGCEVQGAAALEAWKELALIAAHLRAETRPRTRLSPPRSTQLTLGWLQTVEPLAMSADVDTATNALQSLGRAHGAHFDQNWFRDRLPKRPSPLQAVYDNVLTREGRVSTQLRRAHQQAMPLFPIQASQIPQAFWTCAMPDVLTDLPGKPTFLMRTVFMSLAITRVLVGDWHAAAEELNFPAHKGKQWSRYVIGTIPTDQRHVINAAVMDLLPRLVNAPQASRPPVASIDDLTIVGPTPCSRRAKDSHWCPCRHGDAPDVSASNGEKGRHDG